MAEVDHQDSWQRATLAVAYVSGDARHANEVVSKAMDFIEDHVEGRRHRDLPWRSLLMQGKRLDRVNQLIKEEISTLLQRELKDPRLGFVTVTEVETAKDLRVAKVFVSVLGDERAVGLLAGRARQRAGLRADWLRQHLDLRVTPELDFRPDRSMEHAAQIQSLLKQVQGDR